MKILIALLIATNTMAGISKYGDYYLESYKAHFINPGRLSEMGNEIYGESKGEIGYKYNNLFLGATKKKLIAGYQINESLGVEGFFSAKNGEGISSYGLRAGFNLGGLYSFYAGFSDAQGSHFMPVLGVSFEAYKGILFAEYNGQIFHVPDYSFLVGWGKVIDNFHGDLTYKQVNDDSRALTATLGGRTWILKEVMGYAALSKELFFTHDLDIKVGAEYYATSRIIFGVTHELTAFSMKNPKYSDFKVNFLIKYFL